MLNGDHLRRLFADHDRWRIGVAADDVGHDACVRHAEVLYSQNPELWIDDIVDPAGTGVMINGQRKMQSEVFQ